MVYVEGRQIRAGPRVHDADRQRKSTDTVPTATEQYAPTQASSRPDGVRSSRHHSRSLLRWSWSCCAAAGGSELVAAGSRWLQCRRLYTGAFDSSRRGESSRSWRVDQSSLRMERATPGSQIIVEPGEYREQLCASGQRARRQPRPARRDASVCRSSASEDDRRSSPRARRSRVRRVPHHRRCGHPVRRRRYSSAIPASPWWTSKSPAPRGRRSTSSAHRLAALLGQRHSRQSWGGARRSGRGERRASRTMCFPATACPSVRRCHSSSSAAPCRSFARTCSYGISRRCIGGAGPAIAADVERARTGSSLVPPTAARLLRRRPASGSGEAMTTVFHRLGPYEITHEIGRGGMAVVFLATDTRTRPRGLETGPQRHRSRSAGDVRSGTERRGVAAAIQRASATHVPAVYEHGVDIRLLLRRDGVSRRREPVGRRSRAVHCRWNARSRSPSSCADSSRTRSGSKRTLAVEAFARCCTAISSRATFALRRPDRSKSSISALPKALSLSRKVTRNDFGSVAYLSPERLESGEVDAHADFWALGVLLYEMLSGAPPFQAPDTRRLEQQIMSRRRPPSLAERCPAALEAVVAETARGRRPRSATAAPQRFARISSVSSRGRRRRPPQEGWPHRSV